MDQAILVREQFDGGLKLLTRLRDRGFDVAGACWAKTESDGELYLYIISPSVDLHGALPGISQINTTLAGMQGEWSHPFERIDSFATKLVGTRDPLAQGVLEIYREQPNLIPTARGTMLVRPVYVERAYLYPPSLFQPQPAVG